MGVCVWGDCVRRRCGWGKGARVDRCCVGVGGGVSVDGVLKQRTWRKKEKSRNEGWRGVGWGGVGEREGGSGGGRRRDADAPVCLLCEKALQRGIKVWNLCATIDQRCTRYVYIKGLCVCVFLFVGGFGCLLFVFFWVEREYGCGCGWVPFSSSVSSSGFVLPETSTFPLL